MAPLPIKEANKPLGQPIAQSLILTDRGISPGKRRNFVFGRDDVGITSVRLTVAK